MIPPLTPDEYRQLEENILAEGIRDPLVVWEVPNGDMILLDGHNRFEIAVKHHGAIHFELKKMRFSGNDREQAKAWMLKNQLGRRNLDEWKKYDLTKHLDEVERVLAKARMSAGGGDKKSGVPTLAPPIEGTGKTRDKMASLVGVSHGTYDKMKYIDQHGTPEQNKQVRSGDKSINQAWLEIKEREREQVDLSAKAHIEEAKERHEEFQNAKTVTLEEARQDKEDLAEIASGKSRELKNAIKGILFIGATVSGQDNSYSVISEKTLGNIRLQELLADITRAINILTELRETIRR